MAAVTTMASPPLLCDGTEYHADILRRLWSKLGGDNVGMFDLTAFEPSVDGFTATIGPGAAALPSPPTETGVYLVEASAATEFTLTPADATRGRRDVIVAYPVPPVLPEDAGTWVVELVDGEPSATPVAPAPSNVLLLAEYLVPSAASGLLPSVTDRRYVAEQFLITGPPVGGLALPSNGQLGKLYTDAGSTLTYAYNGAEWKPLGGIRVVSTPSVVTTSYTGQMVYAASDECYYVRTAAGQWRVVAGRTPYGEAIQSAAQSIAATGAYKTLDFASASLRGAMTFDNSTNELVVGIAGRYEMSGAVAYPAAFTGVANTGWYRNEVAIPASTSGGWPGVTSYNTIYPTRTKRMMLSVGDRISLRTWNNQTSNTLVDSENASSMLLEWVSVY